jgi:hypothetical protein
MLVLAAGCMELLGGVLFTLGHGFGAILLVRGRGTALNLPMISVQLTSLCFKHNDKSLFVLQWQEQQQAYKHASVHAVILVAGVLHWHRCIVVKRQQTNSCPAACMSRTSR